MLHTNSYVSTFDIIAMGMILLDKPAVEITAENNVTCSNDDVRFDCEVRSSSTLLLSGIEHVIFGGETLICSRSNSSNYTILIHDKMVTVLQTYSSDSNGTSLLKCSIIMNTNGLPIDMWLSINCQNVNIGISRNNSFMVSQGTYKRIHCMYIPC